MTKCVICDRRPVPEGAYCQNCASKLEAEKRRKGKVQPKHFLTYRGHVVGLFPNGNGKLDARLLTRNPKNLPKSKTLDLNHYIEGFNREQIKRFKACILKLSHA